MAHQSPPIFHKSPLDTLSINKYCHRRRLQHHSMSTWENETEILSTVFVNGSQSSRIISWALFVFILIVVDNFVARCCLSIECPSLANKRDVSFHQIQFPQRRITRSDEMRLFFLLPFWIDAALLFSGVAGIYESTPFHSAATCWLLVKRTKCVGIFPFHLTLALTLI